MNEKRKILQIIPTNNVVAIFGNLDNDQEEFEVTVICLALIVETGTNNPEGFYSVEPVVYDDECGSCLCRDIPNYKRIKKIEDQRQI